MNFLLNNTNKPFIVILLAYSMVNTNGLLSAENPFPHHDVTIHNKNNDKTSLMHARYVEVEMLPSQRTDRLGNKTPCLKEHIIGMLTNLNAAMEIKCRIAQYGNHSLLEIVHPKATICDHNKQQWKSLQLTTSNNDVITIETKDKKDRIIIKQNDKTVGYLYPE